MYCASIHSYVALGIQKNSAIETSLKARVPRAPFPHLVSLPGLRPDHVSYALEGRVEYSLVEISGDSDALQRIDSDTFRGSVGFAGPDGDDMLAAFVALDFC